MTVCLDLGLRLLPLAAVIALRAWGSIPSSWTAAAAIHGVPLRRFIVRVLLPYLAPALILALVLVALLATADVSTILLLHPPGESTLPLSLFTIMANAPEALVGSLCLVYLATSGTILLAIWVLAGARRT